MSFKRGDIERATKQLTSLDKVIQHALPRAAKAGADELKAEAERLVPVRSGKLKSGISDRAGQSNERTAVNSAVHVVYNSVFYAAPVERGRYKRPFMRPAAANAKNKIAKSMEAEIKRETNKVL